MAELLVLAVDVADDVDGPLGQRQDRGQPGDLRHGRVDVGEPAGQGAEGDQLVVAGVLTLDVVGRCGPVGSMVLGSSRTGWGVGRDLDLIIPVATPGIIAGRRPTFQPASARGSGPGRARARDAGTGVASIVPPGVASHGQDTPMARPGQPEEVAPAFVFFASEADSSYITGEVLTLLGGEATAA